MGESEHIPAWGQILQREVRDLQVDFSAMVQEQKKEHESIRTAIDNLKEAMATRLPLWATFLIGGLMSLATWGLTKG